MLWTAFESRREAAFSGVLVRFRVKAAAEIHVFSPYISSNVGISNMNVGFSEKMSAHSSVHAREDEVSKDVVHAPQPTKTSENTTTRRSSKAVQSTTSNSKYS